MFRRGSETWGTTFRSSSNVFFSPFSFPIHISEDEFQSQLNLARGEGGGGLEEILWLLVVGRVGNSIDVGAVGSEGGGFGGEAVGGDGDALIVAVEQVEGIGGEVEAAGVAEVDFADEAEIGGGVVGASEGVAAVAGETVVEIVAVLIGIAADGGVDGASAAGGDDAGNFPVVENVSEKFLAAVKGTRVRGKSGDEALALVGDAGTALGVGLVGILDSGGSAGDESILTIVDGVSVGVREAEISSASHAPVDGESCAVVDAGGGALELVDGAELRDGAAERIDARRKRAGERTSVLPGSEGIDGVVAVLKNGAGGIEDGIG